MWIPSENDGGAFGISKQVAVVSPDADAGVESARYWRQMDRDPPFADFGGKLDCDIHTDCMAVWEGDGAYT